MKKNNILLSIITPTLNNQHGIKTFLESIRKQEFPKQKIEILIIDGGSKDKTIEIAQKYGVRIIKNKEVFADIGVNLGMSVAKGELMMVLAVDNIFQTRDSLSKMVNVFSDEKVYAAFPKQAISKKDTIFTKYINTFTDPANHFVYGYAANPRTFYKIYKTIKRERDYVVYDFKSSDIVPLIAFAQGFTVRANFRRDRKNAFDDVAPVIELINKNKQIAYVDRVNLYHHTINSLSHFVAKQAWRTKNYIYKKNLGISHRAQLLSKKQTRKIAYWPIYSLTIFPSVVYALYHLIKDREKMWILHPFMCIISGYTSFFVYITYKFKK